MAIKVVLLQDYNTPYRNNLFNAINARQDIELILVYVGQRSRDRKWTDELKAEFSEYQVPVEIVQVSYTTNKVKLDHFALLKLLNQLRPDVIISQLDKSFAIIQFLRFVFPIKFVLWSEYTIHASRGRMINWKYRLLRNLFKCFISAGKQTDDYLKHVGFNLTKRNCFRMYNSVDELFHLDSDRLPQKFEDIAPIKMLFVGSYVKAKGLHLLLEAIEKINADGFGSKFEFHFAGAGEIEIPQASNIVNHGFIDKEQSVKLYKCAHAFILPTLTDCNPLVVIEAAKCGCVLLLSDAVGNHDEFLKQNGILFKHNAVEEIVNSLLQLMSLTKQEFLQMGNTSLLLSREISHPQSAEAFANAVHYAISLENK